MKIWLDDIHPAPSGYLWCQTVKEAQYIIRVCELYSTRFKNISDKRFMEEDYNASRVNAYNSNYMAVQKIAMTCESQAYCELVRWLNATHRDYPVTLSNKGEGK